MILEVCWDGLWTLSFGLSQFHGHNSWRVCMKCHPQYEDLDLHNEYMFIVGYGRLLFPKTCELYKLI
jgi:hypothetical protein